MNALGNTEPCDRDGCCNPRYGQKDYCSLYCEQSAKGDNSDA